MAAGTSERRRRMRRRRRRSKREKRRTVTEGRSISRAHSRIHHGAVTMASADDTF